MADIRTADQQQHQQAGPVVWALMRGELCEGGDIIGLFANRDLGLGKFVTEARGIHDTFGIDDAGEDENGGLYLEGGCDWLSLKPHTVTTAAELDA